MILKGRHRGQGEDEYRAQWDMKGQGERFEQKGTVESWSEESRLRRNSDTSMRAGELME